MTIEVENGLVYGEANFEGVVYYEFRGVPVNDAKATMKYIASLDHPVRVCKNVYTEISIYNGYDFNIDPEDYRETARVILKKIEDAEKANNQK